MATKIRDGIERRQHRRIDTDLEASCRRIGGRPTPERPMRVLDLSQGGARLEGSGSFLTGDILLMTVEVDNQPLTLKGLVVSCSVHAEDAHGHYAHMAFTSMADRDRDRLGRLLEQLHETTTAAPSN